MISKKWARIGKTVFCVVLILSMIISATAFEVDHAEAGTILNETSSDASLTAELTSEEPLATVEETPSADAIPAVDSDGVSVEEAAIDHTQDDAAPKAPSDEGAELPQAAIPGEGEISGNAEDDNETVQLLGTVSGTCGGQSYYGGNNFVYWSLDTSTGVMTIKSAEGTRMNNYSRSEDVPWYNYRTIIKSVKFLYSNNRRVPNIGAHAFDGCINLTEANILTVNDIGESAFEGCTNLSSLSYQLWEIDSGDGLGLRSIGKKAFSGCTSLPSFSTGGTLKSIGDNAFSGCTSLVSLSISPIHSSLHNTASSLLEIGSGAFSGCTSLSSVTITDSVTTIGSGAFSGCTSLTKATIDSGLTSIEECTFSGCSRLRSVTISDSVTNIGNYAFSNCTSLSSIAISNSVTTIGSGAFSGCTKLTDISVPTSSVSYVSVDGVLFNKAMTTLVSYPGGKNGAYTIPNGVTEIESCAFSECPGLTSLAVPVSITCFGENAFDGCNNLAKITYCGTEAQWNRISGKTSKIRQLLQYHNYSGRVTVAATCETEGVMAYTCSFCGTTKTETITALGHSWSPERVVTKTATTSTPGELAYKCSACGEEQDAVPYYYCGNGITAVLDTGTLTISGSGPMAEYSKTNTAPWYEYRDEITSVVIESGVSTVGASAFRDCANLTGLTIPAGVTAIGASAFYHCTGLTEAVIPAGVTTLGANAFSGCTALERVTIPAGMTTIGNYGFYNCTALTDVTYGGTEEQWNAISVGTFNDPLLAAAPYQDEPEHVHAWDSGAVTTAATCTATGVKTYTCSCGDSYTETIPALGHDWSAEKQIIREATTTETGLKAYVCSRCGETKDEEIIPITAPEPIPVDPNAPTVTVANVRGRVGRTVDVTLDLANNPGLAGIRLSVAYDPVLTLTGVTAGSALSELTLTPPGSLSANPVTLLWDGQDADTTNGTVVILTFAVPAGTADGEYSVTVSATAGDIYDGDMEDVTVTMQGGTVTVFSYIPGDVNGDEVVSGKDVTTLRRYLVGGYGVTVDETVADVNHDGVVNGKDATTLRRYLVGGYGVVLE